MTENKRYSDGSLAKWYYSRNYNRMRAISNGVDEFILNSKKQFKDSNNEELKGTDQLLDELNKLEDKIIILEKENKELKEEKEQLKSDLKSYQNMVKQYINLHIDKIRRRYVNPTKEEVAERTRIIRDLEQLKKELSE